MKFAPVLFWKTYITHPKLEAIQQDPEIQKVLTKLLAGLYKSVDLEKLQVEGYTLFSARINRRKRILFTTVDSHLMLLDYLPNHEYDRSPFLDQQYLSAFLKKFQIQKAQEIVEQADTLIEAIPSSPEPENLETQAEAIEYNGLWKDSKQFIFFSPEQETMLHIQLPAIINGGPGSGKTTGALEFLHQAQDSMRTLVWSRESDDIPRLLYITNAKHDSQNLVNQTREQWLLRQQSDDLDPLPIRVDFETLTSFRQKGVSHHYDLIVVDEAQNFTTRDLFGLLCYAKNQKIVYFYDSHQNMLQDVDSLKHLQEEYYREHHKTVTRYSLDRSYRNPPKICELLSYTIQAKTQLAGGAYTKGDVLALYSASLGRPGEIYWIETVQEPGFNELQAALNDNSTEWVVLVQDGRKEEASHHFPASRIMTIEEAQGLQYRVVILYELLSSPEYLHLPLEKEATVSNHLPKKEAKLDYEIPMKKLYTAISRTSQAVIFIQNSQFKDPSSKKRGKNQTGLKPLLESLRIAELSNNLSEIASLDLISDGLDLWEREVFLCLERDQWERAQLLYQDHVQPQQETALPFYLWAQQRGYNQTAGVTSTLTPLFVPSEKTVEPQTYKHLNFEQIKKYQKYFWEKKEIRSLIPAELKTTETLYQILFQKNADQISLLDMMLPPYDHPADQKRAQGIASNLKKMLTSSLYAPLFNAAFFLQPSTILQSMIDTHRVSLESVGSLLLHAEQRTTLEDLLILGTISPKGLDWLDAFLMPLSKNKEMLAQLSVHPHIVSLIDQVRSQSQDPRWIQICTDLKASFSPIKSSSESLSVIEKPMPNPNQQEESPGKRPRLQKQSPSQQEESSGKEPGRNKKNKRLSSQLQVVIENQKRTQAFDFKLLQDPLTIVDHSEGTFLIQALLLKNIDLAQAIFEALRADPNFSMPDYLNQKILGNETNCLMLLLGLANESVNDRAMKIKIEVFALKMMKAGASGIIVTPDNKSFLMRAIKLGLYRVAKTVIEELEKQNNPTATRAYIDTQSLERETALTLSLAASQEDMACHLIKLGAKIGGAPSLSTTELMMASARGLIQAVILILERLQNNPHEMEKYLNKQLHNQATALLLAANNGYDLVASYLIEKGADIDLMTQSKESVLYLAAEKGLNQTVSAILSRLKSRSLKERQVYLDHQLHNGINALLASLAHDHESIATALIDCGANITITPNRTKITPLILAAEKGYKNFLGMIFNILRNQTAEQRQAYLDVHTHKGGNALTAALLNGQESVAYDLLELGASIEVKEKNSSPLILAAERGFTKVVTMILESLQKKSFEQRKAYIELQGFSGSTALIVALANKREEVACLLIQSGAKIQVQRKECCTPLIFAVQFGMEKAFYLICEQLHTQPVEQRKEYLDRQIPNNNNALILALSKKKEDIACLLIELGANVLIQGEKGITPLILAAQFGMTKAVRMILNSLRNQTQEVRRSHIEHKGYERENALMLALSHKREQEARLLIEFGASLQVESEDGATPLMLASQAGMTTVVPMILERLKNQKHEERQIYLDRTMANGFNALMLALLLSEEKEAIASLLIEAGATVDRKIREGLTPLMVASQLGSIKIVTMILESFRDHPHEKRKAYIDSKLTNGNNALILALLHKQEHIACLLLQSGSQWEVQCEDGATPLLIAAQHGMQKFVHMLLKLLKDQPQNLRQDYIDQKMTNGNNNALIIALATKNEGIACALMKSGADVKVRMPKGFTPLILAVDGGLTRAFDIIVDDLKQQPDEQRQAYLDQQMIEGENALTLALANKHESMACALIRLGARLDIGMQNGVTPLMLAVENGLNEVFTMLVDYLKKLTPEQRQAYLDRGLVNGENPLILALSKKYEHMGCELIRLGATIEVSSETGVTPLMLAVEKDLKYVFPIILNYLKKQPVEQRQAYLDQQLANGNNALLLALNHANEDIACQLVDMGCNIYQKNQKGLTPLILASQAGMTRVVRLILQTLQSATARAQQTYLQIRFDKLGTAYDLAKSLNHNEIAMQIKSHEELLKLIETESLSSSQGISFSQSRTSPLMVIEDNRTQKDNALLFKQDEKDRELAHNANTIMQNHKP